LPIAKFTDLKVYLYENVPFATRIPIVKYRPTSLKDAYLKIY